MNEYGLSSVAFPSIYE